MQTYFRALLCLLALAVLSTPDFAQQDSQIPTFVTRTDVVLIPVVVRSKSGPVEDLKPEQFSVTEDGKPQKLASAELVKTGTKVERRMRDGEFSNELVAPQPARLSIIGIDMINTPFLDQTFAREQLLKYVADSINVNEQVAVFEMNRDGSIRQLHDISTDSRLLVAAIKSMKGSLTGQSAESKTTPVYSKVDAQRSVMASDSNPNLGTGDPGLARAANEEQAFQAFKESSAGAGGFELRRNMEATLSSMRQIVEAFSGAPGRKSFIWITGSFPFDINGSADLISPKQYFTGSTQEADAYYKTHDGALPPLPDSTSVVNDNELNPLRQKFRTLMQQFAGGNIVLYPVDARGLLTLGLEAADEHTNELLVQLDRQRNQISHLTIQNMANMTGGKTCYNRNEIVSCVRDASSESEQYYLLSYYRDKNSNKQGWRKLSVKVDQPGVEVRTRTGYFYGNDAKDKNARDREISAAMRSNIPFTSIAFSARFMSATGDGNKKAVKYEIFIPPATVDAANPGDNKVQLEIIAVAGTPKDPKVDLVAETLGKDFTPEVMAVVRKQGIAYNNTLKLPPGEYSVHFMVRNVATNVVGSVIAPLKVE